MIVMKFGGSSLESPEAIRCVCGIVTSHISQHPIVVVSAIGETTDQLLSMAVQASKGHGYRARKAINAVQDTHFRISDDLVCGLKLDFLERSLQRAFRELHAIIHDLSEDGRELTLELSDHIMSFGERLSSEIVAAALVQSRVPAVHLDAREFILTDGRHGSATPLEWETYGRLRRSIPQLAKDVVVVMGGFIGATESGVTTTLGRGGSDLTASLVGAGIGAEEIQIWTDVDGMLTCDPRVLPSVHRLRTISFEEAIALAGSGAKVLHPDTIQPAMRQRIPVTIRNSRYPEIEGTRIFSMSTRGPEVIKALAVKENIVLLEITSREYPTASTFLSAINDLCVRKGIEPALFCAQNEGVLLGLTSNDALEAIQLELHGCVEVHLRTRAALLTLVSAGLSAFRGEVENRVLLVLKNIDVQLLPGDDNPLCFRMIVPQSDCRRGCSRLHQEFFSRVDAALFAPVELKAPAQCNVLEPVMSVERKKTFLLGRRSPRSCVSA